MKIPLQVELLQKYFKILINETFDDEVYDNSNEYSTDSLESLL